MPKTLPPSFKGVAVRYVYTLQATAQYAAPKPFTPSTSMPLSSSASLADPAEPASPFAAAAAADQATTNHAGPPRLLIFRLGSGLSACLKVSEAPSRLKCITSSAQVLALSNVQYPMEQGG